MTNDINWHPLTDETAFEDDELVIVYNGKWVDALAYWNGAFYGEGCKCYSAYTFPQKRTE
jgi:hypothetical protein